jgi:hypothetical protein
VHRALAELVADLKPLATDAPPAANVEEAHRLLDEAQLISDAVQSTTAARYGREELLLSDPAVRSATEQLLARRVAALGVADRVPEQLGGTIRSSTTSLREKLPLTEADYDYKLPKARDLEGLDRSAAAYGYELRKVATRASVDGGLRAIAPSARPAQARAAEASWLMREVESMPAIAADAPAEAFVDSSARRVSLVADLIQAVGSRRSGAGTADGDVLRRAASEVTAIDDLWRYPDDTALALARARRTMEGGPEAIAAAMNDYRPAEGIVGQLRDVAADLRAWSALTDGALPHSSLDRISVAARRSDALRSFASDMTTITTSDQPSSRLATWLDEVDARLTDLDTTLAGAMPRAERTAVDDALAALRVNLDQHAALQKTYQGSKWTLDSAALESAVERIAQLDAKVQLVNVEARATDAERLAW